jgi:hypothetical protein
LENGGTGLFDQDRCVLDPLNVSAEDYVTCGSMPGEEIVVWRGQHQHRREVEEQLADTGFTLRQRFVTEDENYLLSVAAPRTKP